MRYQHPNRHVTSRDAQAKMIPLSGEADGSIWVFESDFDDTLGQETVKEI